MEFMIEALKEMNAENERAMEVHQKMLQGSIDYLYKVRALNREEKAMSTEDVLLKLQDERVVNHLQNPKKLFTQLANKINLEDIPDESTRLMVGALINLGKAENRYVTTVNDSINQLLRVHQASNDINEAKDEQLQHQMHDALSMFNIVQSDPHEHNGEPSPT